VILDEWGATYWSYDAVGRPVGRQDPRGTAVYYAYGPSGQRTQLTVVGQGTVYYEYGPTGQMDLVVDGKSALATYYDYDPVGRVSRQRHPNGATTYFSYDLAGRLGEKVTRKDADGSVLVRFAYTRDAAGNPIAIEREPALGSFYYEYDALQRLSCEGQFVSGAREYENYYEYDAAGNRTLLRHGETGAENLTYYEYDGANELTALHDVDGWTYFAYDANGNTVAEQTPSHTRYFDWDGRDMLVGVRSTEDGWTDNEVRYDGLGSRASLFGSDGLAYFTWDGIRVLKLADEAGGLKQRQVHGHAPMASVGDIVMMQASAKTYVPEADQVGTLWQVFDSSAAVANAYQYDAFGVGRAASESFDNPFRFAGKHLDEDPALYHFTARQYDPRLGRFISRDPAGYGGSFSVYLYCRSMPGWYVDPMGLDWGPAEHRQAAEEEARARRFEEYQRRKLQSHRVQWPDRHPPPAEPRDWTEPLCLALCLGNCFFYCHGVVVGTTASVALPLHAACHVGCHIGCHKLCKAMFECEVPHIADMEGQRDILRAAAAAERARRRGFMGALEEMTGRPAQPLITSTPGRSTDPFYGGGVGAMEAEAEARRRWQAQQEYLREHGRLPPG
jgi:RHS repeat-associated protein